MRPTHDILSTALFLPFETGIAAASDRTFDLNPWRAVVDHACRYLLIFRGASPRASVPARDAFEKDQAAGATRQPTGVTRKWRKIPSTTSSSTA
jgi:hypothetical protein